MQIFNMDCFELLKTLPDNSVDSIITDPPYGILKHKIEIEIDIPRFFEECYRVLKPNSFIVFFGQQPTLTTWNAEAFKWFKYKAELVWYKRQRTSPMNDMGRVFENITICCKGKRKFNQTCLPYLDVKESLGEFSSLGTIKRQVSQLVAFFKNNVAYEDAVKYVAEIKQDMHKYYTTQGGVRNDIATLQKDALQKTKPTKFYSLDSLVNGIKPQNLVSFVPHNKLGFDMSREGKGKFNLKHPTVKPEALMRYLIDICTTPGGLVLDMFMGTGSTGIAALQTGRKFIGCELMPEYFEIVKIRKEDYEKELLNCETN